MEADNKPQTPTADQLLQLLDIQLTATRERRTASESNRTTFRVLALAFIVIGAAVSLWVLMYVLEEMRPQKNNESAGTELPLESAE